MEFTMVKCGSCSQPLRELPNTAIESRIPCPKCGSLRHNYALELMVKATVSAELVAQKISEDGTEAIRIGDSQRISSSVDLNADGSLTSSIEGSSPENEFGTLKACNILIEKLNQNGSKWRSASRPDGPESGIDCVTSDGVEELHIQVTRVMKGESWRTLGESGKVCDSTTVENAPENLHTAIKRKEKIPARQRMDILLALDAIDTPAYVIRAVVEAFRWRFGTEVHGLGFKAIWVVGPTTALTMRLDTYE